MLYSGHARRMFTYIASPLQIKTLISGEIRVAGRISHWLFVQ
jgi:hypothetical protein